ncbi:MAG: phosphopantothenoylcysteine decarboxylase [Oscillospiraceae bacterium]|jgi:phosphopantothenoylcysteine decarboxylase/phosphopantothenoylcysteine decarboxylase/phosphopantothenate--cysteine ligase|nr:phosphopantothenoylcysteine decarboxylase [Oscillospiraceae bacterium]
MKNVVLGVTGSIAAYKAAEITSRLTKNDHAVHVILTAAAQKFITPLTLQTLAKRQVYTGMFDEPVCGELRHISLAQQADLLLIAPATANFIGKIASGIADDMLTTVVMAAAGKPVLICPAMNTAMLENPITTGNIEKLKAHGCLFVEPREAHLACGDLGRGALAGTDAILQATEQYLK